MITIVEDTKNLTQALTITEDDGTISELEAVGSALKSLGASSVNLFRSFQTPSDVSSVGAAVGQAAADFIDDSLQGIYDKLKQTRKVKLKTLLNLSGGAFARTPDETLQVIAERLTGLVTDFAQNMGNSIMNDPEVKASIYALEEVQAIAQVASDILTLYYAVKDLADELEPAFPILEIISNAASIWATGGGVVPEMSSRAAQMAMQELKKLVPLLLYPLKEQILNSEVQVPVLLLGGLQRLQTAEAQQRWAETQEGVETWLNVHQSQYQAVVQDLTWTRTYDAATAAAEANVISPYVRASVSRTKAGRDLQRREEQGENAWKEFTSASAFSDSIPRALEFDQEEIISLSRELVQAQDSSTAFYVDRQMHRLVLEELKADGALIDIEKRTYDEKGTKNAPRGDRAAFKEVNRRITTYHNVLQVLTGEIRANITEDIPVVDFYRKNQTSLRYVFNTLSSGAPDFTTISSITDEGYLSPTAPTSTELLSEETPFFINFALSQYDPKIHFYNTRARFPKIPDIQVDYARAGDEGYVLRASGLLNGLFTSPATYADNGEDIETWQWGLQEGEDAIDYQDLAAQYGVSIPLGVKYTPTHLIGGSSERTIVPRPLAYTPSNPTLDYDSLGNPYPGLATKHYENLVDAVENQMITAHQLDATTWASLGGFLEDVVTIHDKRQRTIVGRKKKVSWKWSGVGGIVSVTPLRTYTPIYGMVSDAAYGEKLDYFVGDEDRLNPTIWSGKISGSNLSLNIDQDSDDIAVNAKFIPSRRRLWGWLWSTQHTSQTTAWIDHPSRVFNVQLNGLSRLPAASGNVVIEKIECIMPQEVIRKNSLSVGLLGEGGSKQARLLIPTEHTATLSTSQFPSFPNKMYLLSTTALGFEVTAPRSLCTFYNENYIFSMEVQAVDYVPSPAECDNFYITYNGTTYAYEEGVHDSSLKPELHVVGSSCYIYTLRPKEITYAATSLNMKPAKYPREFLSLTHVLGQEVFSNLKEDVERMRGMDIAVGLPAISAEDLFKNYKRNNSSNSLRALDLMSGRSGANKDYLKSVLRGVLKDIPIITTAPVEVINDEGVEEIREVPDVTLEQMPALLKPLIETANDFDLLNKYTPDIDISTFVSRIQSKEFHQLYEEIDSLMTKIDSGGDLYNICLNLDAKLGNAADPWLSVGDDPTDHIAPGDLERIAEFIKTSLEGDEATDVPQGSPSSLYYQRYLFLNNRMHWTSGHLAQAAQRMINWQDAEGALSLGNNRLEAYEDYISTAPVLDMPLLEYFVEERDSEGTVIREGKFYNKEILQAVEESINDKCLLACIPCPVADSCPFFSRDKVIREFIPAADSVELWLKDNQLNLLVYEQDGEKEYLDIKTAEGKLLDINRYKDRQKTYVEIVRNPATDISLADVRNAIAKRIPNYCTGGDTYADELGWLQGGRYGSLKKSIAHPDDPKSHRYLYDAIFVRDEDTEFIYTNSTNYYPVRIEAIEGTMHNAYEEPTVYEGRVRIKIPSSLRIFEGVSADSDIYLVSDDTQDAGGKPISPIIYINTLGNLQVSFDLTEDNPPATESTGMDDVVEDPSPEDIAQWHANTYKWLSEGYDQWWMSKVRKKSPDSTNKNITLEGRKRIPDVVDPLVTETPDIESVVNGKPFVNTYVNFLRKVRIRLSCFQWVKGAGEDAEIIEIKKQTLTNMKTNVRLVVIKK
jgi:hypothetical protein